MKMLSVVACSAFAALMFVACSDDSVTTAVPLAGGAGQGGGVALDSTRNVSVNFKGCYGHPYGDALMKTAAENPKAYLVVDDAGYHVVILDVMDACGYASIVFNNQRVLDTLKINFDGAPTDCMCLTDEWFNIDPLDADIKYLMYQHSVYEVVTEPLPVRSSSSNTTVSSSSEVALSSAVVSSSSETPVLSSSSALVESSSSVAPPGPTHHIITDATAQCSAKNRVTDDPWLDGATPVQAIRPKDEALPPIAYRYAGTERTGFTIENVAFACDVSVDTLDVYVIGETVYVNAKMNYDNAKRCLCESKVSFAVDNNQEFWLAKTLVLDDGSSINFQNKMDIYDMDVITIEEVMTHQTTLKVNVVCRNDRVTMDSPSLANSIQVPVLDPAPTKEIYAVRYDNGDGSETISINELDIGCGVKDAQFDVYVNNDTLYVKSSEELYATNCICPSRVDFTIKKGLQFTNTHYLVFDNRNAMPLKSAKY